MMRQRNPNPGNYRATHIWQKFRECSSKFIDGVARFAIIIVVVKANLKYICNKYCGTTSYHSSVCMRRTSRLFSNSQAAATLEDPFLIHSVSLLTSTSQQGRGERVKIYCAGNEHGRCSASKRQDGNGSRRLHCGCSYRVDTQILAVGVRCKKRYDMDGYLLVK